jgi:hypothetical protein
VQPVWCGHPALLAVSHRLSRSAPPYMNRSIALSHCVIEVRWRVARGFRGVRHGGVAWRLVV